MVLYVNQNQQFNNLTPAQRYAIENDFSHILNDISLGNLPTNTGVPFPVEWKEDNDTPPWQSNSVTPFR